ncbi:hypothetical protein SAMN05660776_2513 [Salegentibacter holothuriorum]|uniref:Uncharacterized protein n=2 Tax=Salegentibacter holothuriorum TaxID=241145 RepID=A0A1T5D8T6_9FLAO|nr:hypothetical protein SAMN05660776_2513 [Salegentibacter holothuriorum]
MEKRSTFIILLFTVVMLFNSIKSGFMISFYLVDNPSFTELFCVNKDKPEMECNGKCEISKLSKDSTTKEKPTHLDFLQRQVILFFNPMQSLEVFQFSEEKETVIAYLNNYTYQYLPKSFHPPSFKA